MSMKTSIVRFYCDRCDFTVEGVHDDATPLYPSDWAQGAFNGIQSPSVVPKQICASCAESFSSWWDNAGSAVNPNPGLPTVSPSFR